jgi:AbrB family looped-hinge helix DNA binding protein
MESTKLSSKGQVIIPKAIRDAHHWQVGQELIVIETENGVLLQPKQPFEQTSLEEVAGCLHYKGKPKTLKELDNAIALGINKQW